MNWKFWQNKKARVAVPVAAAAVVVVAVGTVIGVNLAGSGGITQQQAQSIALKHAGVEEGDTLALQVSRDDGVYDVSFRTADRSYEYEIQSRSGKVLDFSYESANGSAQASGNSSSQATPASGVTEDQAKAIALEHAGVAESDATFYRVEQDRDNGRNVYEVEFYSGTTEYDYEIDRDTGEIVSCDADIEGWKPQGSAKTSGQTGTDAAQASESSSGQATATSGITEDQAKSIALEHAGVAEGDVTFHRVEQDRDHGRNLYEVEFYAGTTEYDYEIDRDTGDIVSYDSDIEGWAVSSQSGTPVTLDQARQLVVDRISGIASGDVQIHEDWDDGRQIYEGEAWYNGVEYEFEIDASTGAFLQWSSEHH